MKKFQPQLQLSDSLAMDRSLSLEASCRVQFYLIIRRSAGATVQENMPLICWTADSGIGRTRGHRRSGTPDGRRPAGGATRFPVPGPGRAIGGANPLRADP